MNITFQITQQEMTVLQGILALDPQPWLELDTNMKEQQIRDTVAAMQEKGYLLSDEQGRLCVQKELCFYLAVVTRPYGWFRMEKADGDLETIFFLGDAIVWLSCKKQVYELMWLPYLPLTIGRLASMVGPFLNQNTIVCESHSAQLLDTVSRKYQDAGYSLQWRFTVCESDRQTENRILILENATEQVMINVQADTLTVTKPNKADYVNACTRMMAPVHGNSIRKGASK